MKAKLKVFNEILSWVLLIGVSVLLVFSIFTVMKAKQTGESAFIFGYRPVLVLTGSMEPYMMTNGLALTKEVTDISDIEVGDVITFHLDTESGDRLLITHRIIAMDEEFIYTKGDNNNVADSTPLTIDNVEAKVVGVTNITAWIAAKWQTTTGKVLLISGALAIIFVYLAIKMWISWLIDRKSENGSDGEVIEGEVVEATEDNEPNTKTEPNAEQAEQEPEPAPEKES